MTTRKTTDQHHLRQRRIRATDHNQPIKETIKRAKLYIDDQVWLSPVELKGTIRQLAETLESMLDNPSPAPIAPKPVASKPAKAPKVVSAPEPTHTGNVLGLKGRKDYVAHLTKSGPDQMTDQHDRSFNLKDYGYDQDETYRLDLSSVRDI